MDPLAHTLFGTALAESGLKHRSRYATATLLIGANLPDIDAIAGFWGSDFELYARRGHTHGILAMLALPLLLTGAVMLWYRWRSRASPASDAGVPPNYRMLLALSFLSVWSHPLLDWLNTYGVRFLMPFDSRWFYGDTLFIVDPWFWLLAAGGVVLARSESGRAITGWSLLGLLATGLVLGTSLVPIGAKIAWCAGLVLIVALRWWRPAWATSTALARTGLLGLGLYVGVAYAGARLAESALLDRFPQALRAQANPTAAVPLSHRVVLVEQERYRILATNGTTHEVPRIAPDAIVQAAMASDSIRGFMNWTRFPTWEVEDAGDHWRVRFTDLRYRGPDILEPRGIGLAEAIVPKDSGGLNHASLHTDQGPAQLAK